MKRKYREAMRAAARDREAQADEDAAEVRDWYEEWAMSSAPEQQDESKQEQPR